MPGGVNSPARAFGAVGGHPLFVRRAWGAHVEDIDGNSYVDYVGSWGPMILGHAFPAVVQAIVETAARGTSFGAATEAETELADMIIEALPSIGMVRLVNSGTEATMSAIRLARAFTGRDRIVKFAGNYHGHVDSLLVAAGSSAATLGVPDSPGVTAGTTADTIVVDYNDADRLGHVFERFGREIAAVIFEPVAGNMGVVVPQREFLESLSGLARRYGSLLICDEVMTGFRVTYGGAQTALGIDPDLTTLGKIVGGGLPVGAYGGREAVMRQVLPAGKVFQAGTLSGNPLATAAGIATLKVLRDEPPYDQLERMASRLETGLRRSADRAGVAHSVGRMGSMMTLFFSGEPVRDWPTASRCDTERFRRFFWSMVERSVLLPWSQYEAMFVSAAHGEGEIEQTIAAADAALQDEE
jgi:glutamate-1-semialdehyde 2,1-aminomutase